MQSALTYRTNRDLFSNHYLSDHLRQTEPWKDVDQEEVKEAYDEIRDLWTDKQDRVADYNEAQLERNFIRPVFDILGIPFEIEETVMRTARRPDYGFFPSAEAADAAFDRADFYEEAIAVADAKYWGRELDTRGEKKRDYENPSYQIHDYLMETPPQWGVLTNGQQWRLYYGPTSHRLDSYYEIDLPELIQFVEGDGGIEDFKDFYLFFRQQSFLPDRSGDCFLDDVYDESGKFAEAIGEDLQNNIYEAIRVLAEGFLDTNDDLDEDDLPLIHDSSLIYLYRLIFVLYAESEGRDLLPTNNDIYSGSYSLNELKEAVADRRDETQQHYQTFQTHLWDRLEELFVLIDQGSQGEGIPKDQLYIPAYNGGLFRTSPDPDDSEEAQFLANHEADDAHLAEVIDLLTRRDADEGDGQVFVDYSSLDERHLGSIYEGLLEYKLDVADEPLTVDDGEYSPAGDSDEIKVQEGDVYLRTDAGERKATGSYYTPEYVVEYIVDETLGPLVEDIRADLVSESADTTHRRELGFAEKFADRVFDLKVLDPAMGSGHFLVNAVDYLAREIIDAQERQDQQAIKRGDDEAITDPRTEEGELRDVNWARRKVAQQCLYGVDLNPLATELAKVSLWLRTLAAEQPLAFLDHHLKTGNSLVGSDIEDVLTNGDDVTEEGQLTLEQSFDYTRQRAMEHVTDRFQDLLNIDNETLEDIKEMEAVYDDVRADPLYKKLLAMANIHTADVFGLDVPEDADERMAKALDSDSWETIEEQDWFKNAQAVAEDERFFHWELEFPMAFYDQDGRRKEETGFDAVIGNPPYLLLQGTEQQSAMKALHSEIFTGSNDLSHFFIKKGIELLRNKKRLGFVITRYWLESDRSDALRKYIATNAPPEVLIDFGNLQIWPSINVLAVISIFEKQQRDVSNVYLASEYNYDSARDFLEQSVSSNETSPMEVNTERLDEGAWNLRAIGASELWDKVSDNSLLLSDISDITQGIKTGNNEAFTVTENQLNENSIEEDLLLPLARSKDIRRYSVSSNRYLIYTDDSFSPENYPNAYRHLKSYKKSLSGRAEAEKGRYPWWRLQRPRDHQIVVADEKLLVPHYATKNRFAFTEDGTVGTTDSFIIVPSDKYGVRYLSGILNSELLNAYMKIFGKHKRAGYLSFAGNRLKNLPIPTESTVSDFSANPTTEVDGIEESAPQKMVADCSSHITELLNKREGLNLDLLDYLGNYKEGPDLPDIGLYQPTKSNILNSTTEKYEKLQIEQVRTERDSLSITIEATARYKPEDEEEFETDTYGYTETEFFEAFTLADLTDEEAALIEAFVPIAVDEEIGGFRDNATQTNSLIDRLKDITVPDIDDIHDDFQRYVETKKLADELDETIKKTDNLIDEIVYDLYSLTEEEIEIVEEVVNSN